MLYIIVLACLLGASSASYLLPVALSSCPAGFFCPAADLTRGVNPQPCPAGTYSHQGWTACRPCPAGYWTTRSGSAYCDICPQGHRCPTTEKSPEACPLGTANSKLGQTACTPCSVGYYTPTLERIACTQCPRGHYCDNSAEQPKQCPPGQYDYTISNLLKSAS
ncbi:unnamed protein product [Rotaria sp. Silwood1]|nr:unnamed protein product [Rotaria sp. Silwood1]CAF4674179.1 unnamed protein product [Rotaria sp. Silwood1]